MMMVTSMPVRTLLPMPPPALIAVFELEAGSREAIATPPNATAPCKARA